MQTTDDLEFAYNPTGDEQTRLTLAYTKTKRNGEIVNVYVDPDDSTRCIVSRGDFWWRPGCSADHFATISNRGFQRVAP